MSLTWVASADPRHPRWRSYSTENDGRAATIRRTGSPPAPWAAWINGPGVDYKSLGSRTTLGAAKQAVADALGVGQ